MMKVWTPEEHDMARSDHGRPWMAQVLALSKVDFPPDHRQPRPVRFAVAALIAVVGSLAADAALVAIGTALVPSTRGYVHFRFSDYGKLTIVGVLVACMAWPVVTWISSVPRWLFLRLAVIVTLVLWAPDLWILVKGEPVKAVLVLMAMHVAIAVVTYVALVHVSPPRQSKEREPLGA